MLRAALTLALPLALLTACASTTPGTTDSVGSSNGSSAVALDAYHWQLSSATDKAGQPIAALQTAAGQKPVQLDFSDRVNAYAGCNYLSGGYSVNGTTLSIGNMISTMIGCPQELALRDQVLGAALEKPLTIRTRTTEQLVLVSASGDVLDFKGVPTAETRYGGPGKIEFLEVGPELKPCTHGVMANAQCLQVRPVQYNANGGKQPSTEAFSHFYGQIEGYRHEAGIRNVLRVKRFDIANPPADAPSKAYVLDMVVESENTRL
jgi:heat shock protein HslJ